MKKTTTLYRNRKFSVYSFLVFATVLFSISAFGQGGAKWATGLNLISTGDAFGTSNNFPIIIKVNNVQRGSFTNTGFDVYGNIHSTGNSVVDSILSAWKIMVADALSVGGELSVSGNAVIGGTLNAGQIFISGNSVTSPTGNISFGNNNLVSAGTISGSNITALSNNVSSLQSTVAIHDSLLTEHQSAIAAHDSALAAHQSAIENSQSAINTLSDSVSSINQQLSAITSSQWQTTGNNSISYTGDATVSGNFQSGSISTGQLAVSDKFIAPRGDFDTLHTAKTLEVNNSLKISKEDFSDFAEVSTKDTNVVLALQKEVGGMMVVGNKGYLPPPVERYKLTVVGNTNLVGDVKVEGNINVVGDVNANNISSLQSSADSLQATVDSHQTAIDNLQTEAGNQQAEINNLQTEDAAHDSLLNNHQSAINTLSDSVSSVNQQLSAITSSQWQSTGTNSISYSGNAAVNGAFSANEINTANITITDKISTKTAEFDTLRVAERMEVEKYIQSDTLHALKSLEVNNSLRLVRDDAQMYAEVSTKDTAVTLMLQKEYEATVEIGEAAPPAPGEGRAKLTVVGNTKLDGSVNVSGTLHANCVNTGCLNVSGQTSFEELNVNTKIKTARIVPLDGDSIIAFGNNTLLFNTFSHTIYTDDIGPNKGIGIGAGSLGFGLNSLALGIGSVSAAPNSVTIGNSPDGGLANIVPNSLMVGFNTNGTTPTLFIGPADGSGNSTGNVGIGTSSPQTKLDVIGSGHFSDNVGLGTNSPQVKLHINHDGTAIRFQRTGFQTYNIEQNYNGGLTFTKSNSFVLHLSDFGNIGIGTNNPGHKLDVRGNISNGGADFILGQHDGRIQKNKTLNRALVHDGWQQGKDDLVINYDGDFEDGVFVGGPKLVVDGKLGIGTTDIPADYKLAVNGWILAEDVTIKLYQDWPDFVYESGYKRPTIEERKKYHEKFGHMMYMDSAKEIKKNGLNISKNFIGLTRNVEEVSEDVIVLQKTVIELQEEIKQLKAQIKKDSQK